MGKWDSYADKYKTRPNPKANRPRTKERPKHADAIKGRIISVDRGRYAAVVEEGTSQERTVNCMRAKDLRNEAIVTGDIVGIVGDTSGQEGTLGRIVRVEERTNFLRRSGDDTDQLERILVANVDNLVIVTAAANPEPRTGLIDRMIVAGIAAGIKPYLCVTKTDLASADELREHYEPLGVDVFESSMEAGPDGSFETGTVDEASLEMLDAILNDKITVLAGHSGVGKSTLVNALTGSDRAVGHVNETTGRGRHTSSSTLALPLQDGGWIIDTPGIRSFGLAHVDRDDILTGFPEIKDATSHCEKGCLHDEQAVNCGIDELLLNKNDPRLNHRAESLRRLLKNVQD